MSVADPKPGTAEAATRGCTCPSAMNPRQADSNDKLTWDADGTWWVHMDCPVHRATPGAVSDTRHTYPVGDLIEHVTDGGDCPCGPTTEAVMREDGSNGWHVLHHSLDGREHSEPDHDRLACPLCDASTPEGAS